MKNCKKFALVILIIISIMALSSCDSKLKENILEKFPERLVIENYSQTIDAMYFTGEYEPLQTSPTDYAITYTPKSDLISIEKNKADYSKYIIKINEFVDVETEIKVDCLYTKEIGFKPKNKKFTIERTFVLLPKTNYIFSYLNKTLGVTYSKDANVVKYRLTKKSTYEPSKYTKYTYTYYYTGTYDIDSNIFTYNCNINTFKSDYYFGNSTTREEGDYFTINLNTMKGSFNAEETDFKVNPLKSYDIVRKMNDFFKLANMDDYIMPTKN